MGNCTTKRSGKPSRNYSSSVKISVPDLTYIDRKTKTLISVINQDSFQISLKKKVRLYKDSCISCFSDNSILIAGGSDSSNSLTNSVYLLNPTEKTVKQLPSLPIPCKFGTFLNSSEFIYFVGALCEAQDHDATAEEEGSPLCRLRKSSLNWEIFTGRPGFNATKFLQRKIGTEEMDDRVSMYQPLGVTLKDLHEPGAMLFADRIILVGGKLMQNGEMVPSNKIFSVNLDEQRFGIQEEIICLPVPFISPSCCVYRNMGCIAGGFLSDMSQNISIYLIDFSFNTIRKVAVDLDRPIEPRYPIFMDKKGISCISPPKMMYLREDKKQIFTFTMPTVLKQCEFQSVTNESLKQSECVKKVVDLTINFIRKEEKNNKIQDLIEEVKATKLKQTENPFESAEIEEIQIHFTDQDIPEKTVLCQCGKTIKEDLVQFNICSHCRSNHQELYFCESCDKAFCLPCINELQKFTLAVNPNIQCRAKHFFALPKGNLSELPPLPCSNCTKQAKAPYFYCFVCQETLCIPCEIKITSILSSSDINCAYFHQFAWILSQSPQHSCDLCLSKLKQIGHFYCAPCKFVLCIDCVQYRKETNPKNKIFYKACAYQERPKRLSETLYRVEVNKGDEDKPGMKPSKKRDFSNNVGKVSKVCVRVDSESGNEAQAKANFETSIEEIHKKILQKPKRGTLTPFLSISPRKHMQSTSSAQSPRLIGLAQHTLGFPSIESVRTDRGEERKLSELFSFNPFMIQQSLEEHLKLEKKLPDTEGNISSLKITEDLQSDEDSEESSSKLNPLDSSHPSFVHRIPPKNQSDSYSEPKINTNDKSHISHSAEKLTPSSQFTIKGLNVLRPSRKVSPKQSVKEPSVLTPSSNVSPKQSIKGSSILTPCSQITPKQSIQSSSSLTPCSQLSPKQSINDPSVQSLFNQLSPNPSVREPSVFSTYGDDPDNFVAPEIRGTLAAGKLAALKAKLNLLMGENEDPSSSSEKNSFAGFVYNIKPRESSSLSSCPAGSLSKRESKRYTIEQDSFSKESSKDKEKIEAKERSISEKSESFIKDSLKDSESREISEKSQFSGSGSDYEAYEIQFE